MSGFSSSTNTGPRGHLADLLHWSVPTTGEEASSSARPSTVLLFLPGNPGLPAYYTSFLTSVQAAHPTIEIYALGHLGHTAKAPRAFSAKGAASLREQVEHKIAFVDELQKKYGFAVDDSNAPKLVMMGHSIGSWICCETLKSRPKLISSLSLLFPTISHMALTPNGRKLSPLLSVSQSFLLPPIGLATNFLSFLPTGLLTSIVSLIASQSGHGATVTTQLVASSGAALAALSMGAEELRDVTELDKECLGTYGGRMRFYWAKGDEDEWVLDSSVAEIVQTLEEAGYGTERRLRCEEGMKHAFVLDDAHCDLLAVRVAAWIAEDEKK